MQNDDETVEKLEGNHKILERNIEILERNFEDFKIST